MNFKHKLPTFIEYYDPEWNDRMLKSTHRHQVLFKSECEASYSVYKRFANKTPLRSNRQLVLTRWCLCRSPRPRVIIASSRYKWGGLQSFCQVLNVTAQTACLAQENFNHRSYKTGNLMRCDHFIPFSSHAADWWNNLLHWLLLGFMMCELEAKWVPQKLDCYTLRINCLLWIWHELCRIHIS